jgi:HEPN domain-containing protein
VSPRKTNSNNPADWLFFAEAELDALRLLVERRMAFLMCRSKCAEALEKLVKAELIFLGWPLVKTHDVQQLVDALKDRASPNAERLQPLAEELAEYYFVGRYPGFDFDEHEDWPALAAQLQQLVEYGRDVKTEIQKRMAT